MKRFISLPLALLAFSACDQERPLDPAFLDPTSAPLLSLAPAATATIDFETLSLSPGTSIEGLGTVHSDLNIRSTTAGKTAVLIQEGTVPEAYVAPAGARVRNGCLGNPGGWTGAGSSVNGRAMALIGADAAENYEFTFSAGFAVSTFSLLMLDWGDFNPSAATQHEVKLIAYNAAGDLVDEHVLSYTTGAQSSPTSSDPYGNLSITGDACTAQPGQPGNFTFTVSGPGIVRVVLTSVAGHDPNIALDNISFTRAYDFNGFFRPVENLPVMNIVKAGQGIPVKFSLAGDQGLGIMADGYPKSQPIDCETTTTSNPIIETVTAGGSSLSYDATLDQYVYTWKTDKSWVGTCRQLIVKLADGTEHRANFDLIR